MLEIGVQENGTARISFTPEAAGIYQIYYKNASGGIDLPWITLTVTGGTDE
jgi:hypothetical protein